MYIKYADDPVRKRVNTAFGNVCDGEPKKNALKLIDKCFSIFKKEQQVAAFCELGNLNYPVDGFAIIDVDVCSESTYTVFNNSLETILEATGTYPISATKAYARGVMLWIEYPASNENGAAVLPADMQAKIRLFDRPATGQFEITTHQFFSHFSNPDGDDASDLLNRIDIYNPNTTFSVKLKGLVIFTKTTQNPNDVSC
jgi:hypothetical protein